MISVYTEGKMNVFALFTSIALAAASSSATLPDRPVSAFWYSQGETPKLLARDIGPLLIAHESETGEETLVGVFQQIPHKDISAFAASLSRWWRIGAAGAPHGQLLVIDLSRKRLAWAATDTPLTDALTFTGEGDATFIAKTLLDRLENEASPVAESQEFKSARIKITPTPPSVTPSNTLSSPALFVFLMIGITALLTLIIYLLSRRDAYYTPIGWIKVATYGRLGKAGADAGGIDGSW